MIEIKASTPQPSDCPKCKRRYGYKMVQRIQKYCDLIYDELGNDAGCIYSDSEKIIHTMKRAVCANCNTPLNFKVRE